MGILRCCPLFLIFATLDQYVYLCYLLSNSLPTISLVLRCDIVFACCRHWRNNLNEPLDPFSFGVAAEQKGGQG